jgi:hypothetical protein
MSLGKALPIVVAHVTPFFQNALTVVLHCMLSMHISSVVLAVGEIVAATS